MTDAAETIALRIVTPLRWRPIIGRQAASTSTGYNRVRMRRVADESTLLTDCHAHAVEHLRRNLTPAGVLASAPTKRARERGYTAIFGRDAAVCALGMAVSGDRVLERAAVTGLETLAAHQAPNGQIPKFVTPDSREADFWYLGCIDSTLWWLIALALLDEHAAQLGRRRGLLRRYRREVALALQWLGAQEHQRFFLLQQNEASDWADIMPRSGFVLYTNALWYRVKRSFGLPNAAATRANFNGLFHPFSAALAEYRRARLLNEYALKNARNRDLYLSFVNFSFFGDEGDVFGNVLAVLCGALERERLPPHARRAARERSERAVSRACRRAPDPRAKRALASVHGATPAELRLAVSQRRHLADGRRLLDRGARAPRAQTPRALGAREPRARLRARRLGVRRVAARPHRGDSRNARPIVECRRLFARGARRALIAALAIPTER